METIVGLPYSLTERGPNDIPGEGNYILEVRSSSSAKTEALLYFFDSHMGFQPKGELGSYEWITFDQIDWYRKKSRTFTERNGGVPYPSLAFFHIPLPEYKRFLEKHDYRDSTGISLFARSKFRDVHRDARKQGCYGNLCWA